SPAPEDAAFTRTQLDAFEALARKLRGAGYTLPPLHAQALFFTYFCRMASRKEIIEKTKDGLKIKMDNERAA
ncbi:hypothetical protein, partial [Alistipes putredinis]|uniref:hypothetical protein n=1 Tax=Alistipes putredinis TaxID=28117 RepID=UPI003AB86F7A